MFTKAGTGFTLFAALSSLLSSTQACPDHINSFSRRAEAPTEQIWNYNNANDWHTLNSTWGLCQNGTQQSPIALPFNMPSAATHKLTFGNGYTNGQKVDGKFGNWGFGPDFKPDSKDMKSMPSITFDDQTLYLAGWHIHSPAEHKLLAHPRHPGGYPHAEIHLVHATAEGQPKAVVSVLLDGSRNAEAPEHEFFASFPELIGFEEAGKKTAPASFDMAQIVEVYKEGGEGFWTYKGSLTTPPCTEGLRWFVAREVVEVSVEQMRGMQTVGKFSTRPEQELWMQELNA